MVRGDFLGLEWVLGLMFSGCRMGWAWRAQVGRIPSPLAGGCPTRPGWVSAPGKIRVRLGLR